MKIFSRDKTYFFLKMEYKNSIEKNLSLMEAIILLSFFLKVKNMK